MFNPWVRKISWRGKWQPTPIFLPGKFHRGDWRATVHRVTELDTTQHLSAHISHRFIMEINLKCVYGGVYPTRIHGLASSLTHKCSINGLLLLFLKKLLVSFRPQSHYSFLLSSFSTFFLWNGGMIQNHGIFSMSIYYFCIYTALFLKISEPLPILPEK